MNCIVVGNNDVLCDYKVQKNAIGLTYAFRFVDPPHTDQFLRRAVTPLIDRSRLFLLANATALALISDPIVGQKDT